MTPFSWMAHRLAAVPLWYFILQLAIGLSTSGVMLFVSLHHRRVVWTGFWGLLFTTFLAIMVAGTVIKIRRRGESVPASFHG